MKAALVILALSIAACGPTSGSTTPPPSPVASPVAGNIDWPAISVDDSDSFGIDISGSGSIVSKVNIRSRFGSVTLQGRNVSALVYWKIPFAGYVVYQALALEAHAWSVFWFYCSGSSLTYVYWESTVSSVVSREPMQGSCVSTGVTQSQVSWPAVSMAAPPLVRGLHAQGVQLEIDSGTPGHALFGGRSWVLYPYAIVDCTKTCGSPGWYELHTLLWDSTAGEAAFGIFYFITAQTDQVQLEYGLELPTLGRVSNELFAASWTHAA